MDTTEKLKILSGDARYDLACACGGGKEEHRRRGPDGRWLYPVALGNGRYTVLFKTLLSNACANDCKYCPLRAETNARRCALEPEETAETFINYFRKGKASGLFLSSGVTGTPDNTMERINAVARILRHKHGFRGYIHLKIIPGASEAAIEESFALAGAVSLNIEAPGKNRFERLSVKKDYERDIIHPMKFMARLAKKNERFSKVKCTTQFIVGASDETDSEIVRYMSGIYNQLKFQRVYFSAYQKGLGRPEIPGEQSGPAFFTEGPKCEANPALFPDWPECGAGPGAPAQAFLREHRLYQADFLMRRYGFNGSDIIFNTAGNLSLDRDPKQAWADAHPELYPVNVNKAERETLLKVPGFGPKAVADILKMRRAGRVAHIGELGIKGVRAEKIKRYAIFE
ncbi:MAG: radical SAM protein [Elusimicrobia bacterium]|nr:radical SAM protein [Elusimicrobiota bacterium]